MFMSAGASAIDLLATKPNPSALTVRTPCHTQTITSNQKINLSTGEYKKIGILYWWFNTTITMFSLVCLQHFLQNQ
jgi:hypothetical protein